MEIYGLQMIEFLTPACKRGVVVRNTYLIWHVEEWLGGF